MSPERACWSPPSPNDEDWDGPAEEIDESDYSEEYEARPTVLFGGVLACKGKRRRDDESRMLGCSILLHVVTRSY